MKPTLLLLSLSLLASPAFAGEMVKKRSAKEVVFTRLFNEADTNGNGLLNREEFGNSYGASKRPVVTDYRFEELASFLKIDRGGPPVEFRAITLEDFIEANGGRSINPSKSQIFYFADENDDGSLDLSEFSETRVYPPSNGNTAVNAFDKLDKNDNGLISPAEFGISTLPV